MGIGLGAGAAGAYGLSQGIVSDTQASRVNDAVQNYNPRAFTHGELPPNQTVLCMAGQAAFSPLTAFIAR